jgi:DNA-binding GntR family transcriptional regulator
VTPALARSQVTRTLRSAVQGGDLAPGVTYSAPVLASQLGASPTLVRQALLELVNAGLMRPRPNKGFTVCTVSDQDRSEVAQLLTLLERQAVEAFLRSHRDSDIRALRAVAAEGWACLDAGDAQGFLNSEDEFHRLLCHFAGNRFLTEIVTSLRSRVRPYYVSTGVDAEHLRNLAHEHHTLLRLLTKQDCAPAVNLMEQHIDDRRRRRS